MEKSKHLYGVASKGQWTNEHTLQYESLDSIITQSMLCAERSCGKRYSKRFEWSPELKQAVECVRFWHLLLKRSKGLSIRETTNERARINSGLAADFNPLDQPTIVKHLCAALVHLKSSQKSHVELRPTSSDMRRQ
jgi:hypothetical protein